MRVVAILLFACLFACTGEIELPMTYPMVITDKVINITSEGVTFTAHVLPNDKADKIIKYGFVWGEPNPTLASRRVIIDGDPGNEFSRSLTRDIGSDNDFVRAFVQTGTRTIYGNAVGFVAQGSKAPRIEKLNPVEGFDESEVTLTFSNYFFREGDRITLGGPVECKIVSASDSIVTVRIPPNDLVGLFNFTIFTAGSFANSISRFKILGPVITTLPKEIAAPGEKIIVAAEHLDKGDHFKLSLEDHTGPRYEVAFKVLSPTELEVTIPERPGAVGKLKLEATVGQNTKTSRATKNITVSE